MTTMNEQACRDGLSIEALRELVELRDDGKLYWKPRQPQHMNCAPKIAMSLAKQWNTKYASKEAFLSTRPNGYKFSRINCRLFYAHRVVFALIHGCWPTEVLDHINNNKSDNRICNLREADNSQNQHNRTMTRHNTSGYKGVIRSRGKWIARIRKNKKATHLGSFDDIQEAAHAYNKAAIQLHGEFACINPIGVDYE